MLDPYLHPWDERFHALVAKNMTDQPFVPVLYPDTEVVSDYGQWDRAHVWLHKQPLFLWFMSVSIGIFGATEFAVRLPSIVFATGFILLLFRSGYLLHGRTAGIAASVAGLACYFLFDLVSGHQGTDHNDVCFLFFVSASIWAWLAWRKSPRRGFAVAIGVFAGLAVLSKWLPGLLVFGIWAFSMPFEIRRGHWKPELRAFGKALAVALLLFLPWQAYIHLRFPEEAAFEMEYNARHFSEALEGHAQAWDFHFKHFGTLFGWLILPLLGIGAVVGIVDKRTRSIAVGLSAGIVLVYGFYTMAATKMPAYPLVAALPIFVLSGYGLSWLGNRSRLGALPALRAGIMALACLGMFYFQFDWKSLKDKHLDQTKEGNIGAFCSIHNKQTLKELDHELPDNTLLFNVNGRQYIEAMFYTRFRAYECIPDTHQVNTLSKKGYQVTLFENPRNPIPKIVLEHPRVVILKERLKGFL